MTVASGFVLSLACHAERERECARETSGDSVRRVRGEREGAGYLANGSEDGETEVLLSGLLGRDTSDEFGTELESLLAVEGSL